jgi:hypothetical protein
MSPTPMAPVGLRLQILKLEKVLLSKFYFQENKKKAKTEGKTCHTTTM